MSEGPPSARGSSEPRHIAPDSGMAEPAGFAGFLPAKSGVAGDSPGVGLSSEALDCGWESGKLGMLRAVNPTHSGASPGGVAYHILGDSTKEHDGVACPCIDALISMYLTCTTINILQTSRITS